MSLYLLYLKFFSIHFALVLLISFTGNIIYNILKPLNEESRKYTVLLYSLLIGVVTYVTLFSIITTGFKTVNILFLLFLFFYLHRIKYRINLTRHVLSESIGFAKKHILFILFFSLLFYLYEAIWYFKPGEFNNIIPFVDYVDMYNISQVISQTGQENNKYLISNYYYYAQFHGISPYHFFELWLNGLFSTILPISGALTLMLFVYPLFYFASYIGILAVWEYYGEVNIFKKIISLFLLFVGGMYFEFYNKYELLKWYGGNVGNIAHIWGKKSAILYPFIFSAFICFLNRRYWISIALILALCIVSIGVMPGITGGVFLFLIFNFLHKTFPKDELRKVFLLYLSFIVAFVIIFFVWGNKNEESLGFSNIVLGFFKGFDWAFAKTVFFRILFPVLRLIVIYSPYLIFALIILFIKPPLKSSSRKELKQLLVLLYLILFVGSVAGAVASINIFSGGQFFGYLLPFLLIFILFCFSKEITFFKWQLNRRMLLFQLPFILFFIVSGSYNFSNNIKLQRVYKEYSLNLYSDTYLKNVTTYLNTHSLNPLGVCFMGKEDITKYPLNAYGLTGITFSGMSVKLTDRFHAVSNLSIFDMSLDTSDTFSKSLFKSFEFYNYVKDHQEKYLFTTYEDAKISFINDFNIDYALVYKHGIIPAELEEKISVSYSDSLSGQRLIVFK